ncbi:class I SAM-dependent methyltransferase [soil metagenome]
MNYLQYIIDNVSERNVFAAKKLKKSLKQVDADHESSANLYFEKYFAYLKNKGIDYDYANTCYLKLLNDMLEQRAKFLETGKYANTSYKQVEKSIYSNPQIMDYHMHGLAIAQFTWPEQYARYRFFKDNLLNYSPINNYLEIGGGHCLYAWTAYEKLDKKIIPDIIDISESSLNIVKGILGEKNANYIHMDVFDFNSINKYDFITCGEVIEHVENPVAMLKQFRSLLADNGTVFISTPINAPMIDHIYLFSNENEIRELFGEAGFIVAKDVSVCSENVDARIAEELKLPVMYAAFLKKKL